MPKCRSKTRKNKRKEKMLDKINGYGKDDPTPYEAIENIINNEKLHKKEWGNWSEE